MLRKWLMGDLGTCLPVGEMQWRQCRWNVFSLLDIFCLCPTGTRWAKDTGVLRCCLGLERLQLHLHKLKQIHNNINWWLKMAFLHNSLPVTDVFLKSAGSPSWPHNVYIQHCFIQVKYQLFKNIKKDHQMSSWHYPLNLHYVFFLINQVFLKE